MLIGDVARLADHVAFAHYFLELLGDVILPCMQ